jgi:hypothetical protein
LANIANIAAGSSKAFAKPCAKVANPCKPNPILAIKFVPASVTSLSSFAL